MQERPDVEGRTPWQILKVKSPNMVMFKQTVIENLHLRDSVKKSANHLLKYILKNNYNFVLLQEKIKGK